MFFFKFHYIYLFIVCVCMCMDEVIGELAAHGSTYHAGPGTQTQDTRTGDKCLYL